MKKFILTAIGFFFIIGIMASCSGKGSAEKAKNDSASKNDQSDLTEKFQNPTPEDQAYMDSIMNVQIEEEYKGGLTVKAGKEKVKNIPESTITKMTLPLNVNNKTSVTWEEGDYEITYSYLTEYWDENGEDDKWFPKKVKGLVIAPNETITITDKNDGWEFKNVKLKTILSKEEFAQRFKEQTVFDKAQNKFVPKNQ